MIFMAAGGALEVLTVHAKQHDPVDAYPGEHGRQDAEEELEEGDLAVEGDDQVLRVADGRAWRWSRFWRWWRAQAGRAWRGGLRSAVHDELGEHDTAGVAGEECAG
jgi:hypothetical protein